MIKTFELNKSELTPNFIGSWFIENNLCDELIAFFESNQKNQEQGVVGSKGSINLEMKNRIDLRISPKDINFNNDNLFKNYFENLFECYKDYNNKWPYLSKIASHLEIGAFNIGRYETGQHFQETHCERSGIGNLHRLFAFMTYLNNVEQGGTTYFDNYDLEIEPRKGLTLIWPAEWTHTHRGNKVIKGCKYMITGHLNFSS